MEYLSESAEATKNIAKEFVKTLLEKAKSGPILVGLVGDLGAGKTTFMQGVGEFLGVTFPLSSPTFVIQKNYNINVGNFKHLVHIDAYRLEGEKELEALKWEHYSTDTESIIFIEWPANIKSDLNNFSAEIFFDHEDVDKRKIKIVYGEKF